MATCDKCGESVKWVVTQTDKNIALDVKPDPKGRFVVDKNGRDARVATDQDRRLHRPIFACHWDTCGRR